MHRLVAYTYSGVQRFAVDRSEMLIGSGDDCDIRLPYAGVGRQHARVLSGGARLSLYGPDPPRIEERPSVRGRRSRRLATGERDER